MFKSGVIDVASYQGNQQDEDKGQVKRARRK